MLTSACAIYTAAVCAVFGLPVAHASLPHSLLHLHAHAANDASGDIDEGSWLVGHMCHSFAVLTQAIWCADGVHNDILDVNDNRQSALLVNVLIGCTLFLLPVLDVVPLPVIFGLFL